MLRLLGALLPLGALPAACFAELPDAPTCSNIPAGGCPESPGNDVCAHDWSCTAVYQCASNGWTKLVSCNRSGDAAGDAQFEASSGGASDGSPDGDAGGQGRPDAHGDVPPGGYGDGCTALEAPDCAAATAVLCPAGCCGCEDLFVCASGAWTLWGSCQSGTISRASAQHLPAAAAASHGLR